MSDIHQENGKLSFIGGIYEAADWMTSHLGKTVQEFSFLVQRLDKFMLTDSYRILTLGRPDETEVELEKRDNQGQGLGNTEEDCCQSQSQLRLIGDAASYLEEAIILRIHWINRRAVGPVELPSRSFRRRCPIHVFWCTSIRPRPCGLT